MTPAFAEHAFSKPLGRLDALGWNPRWHALVGGIDDRQTVGRIVRHDGHTVVVACETADIVGRPAHNSDPIAVGDWVVVSASSGRIACTLDRSTVLTRRDPSTGDEQLIAANVDIVVAACSLDRPIAPGFIERLMTVAWDAGARPVVVLTKSDLVDSTDAAMAVLDQAAPLVDAITVSAATGRHVSELAELLGRRTAVIVGHSGAGKSTLVNAIGGKTIAQTGSVRSGDHKGRHTTTARQLHEVGNSTCLIDTPGVRELGLTTDIDSVDHAFEEIAALAADCRFADCAHGSEPGCAVTRALNEGLLDDRRLASWNDLRREAAAAQLRSDPVASRTAGRQQARVYREAQRQRKRPR